MGSYGEGAHLATASLRRGVHAVSGAGAGRHPRRGHLPGLRPVDRRTAAGKTTLKPEVVRIVDVTLLYLDDCPNWQVADERLRQALALAGRDDVRVERR